MEKHTQEINNIKIFKFKIAFYGKHIYICFVLTFDISKKQLLRFVVIASQAPLIYEIDIKENFKNIETEIFKLKLKNLQDLTISNNIHTKVYQEQQIILDSIEKQNYDFIAEFLIKTLQLQDTKFKYEYDVEQYREKKYDILLSNIPNNNFQFAKNNKFFIKAKPLIDPKEGVPAEKLKSKKNIICTLYDKREIVHYIMGVLFGKGKKEFIASVIDITPKGRDYLEITCEITPTIATKFIVKKTQKLILKD